MTRRRYRRCFERRQTVPVQSRAVLIEVGGIFAAQSVLIMTGDTLHVHLQGMVDQPDGPPLTITIPATIRATLR